MEQRCGIPFTISLLNPKYWPTWLIIGLAAILSLFPTSFRHALGRKVGAYIFNNNKKRRHIVTTNLKIAFSTLTDSEIEALALKHLESYGCALVDYSLIFFSSRKRLLSQSVVKGKEYLDAAKDGTNTVILLSAHSVMMEFVPIQIGVHFDIFGFYKSINNPVIAWIVMRSRCRHASMMVSRAEGLRKMVKAMSAERIMVFSPDEDLGRDNAVFAPFYGKEKSTLTTGARLAKISNAVVLPTFAYFDNEQQKYTTIIGPPLENYPSDDALADATNMNQALELLISHKPEQYMWFMKFFYTRPAGEPKTY